MENIKKIRNEIAKAIHDLELKGSFTRDEELMLESLKDKFNEYNEILSNSNDSTIVKGNTTVENEVLKIKSLSKEEEDLFQECFDMFEELERLNYYLDKEEEHKNTESFLYRVDSQEDFNGRLDKLIRLHYELTKKLKLVKEENLNKSKDKKNSILKKIGSGLLVIAVCTGIYFMAKDINKKEKTVDIDTDKNIEYDIESYEYFIGEGVRKSDALSLAANSMKIMDILNSNNAGIKVNDVDEMLLDIYDGKNITSTKEDYDSYDTYADIGNEASTDIFNNFAGVPGYEEVDSNRCASILDSYRYLDVTDGSDYDKFNETLVDAIQKFYLNPSKDTAQNLIDTIYVVNKEDGFLTPSLEGLITELIAGPGASVLVNYGELKVSSDLTKNNITANELINNIVMQIEVYERDCAYTRSLN